MTRNRLEAFSDGVLAIVITIMVLELKVPHGDGLAALRPLVPVFLSYVLSFVYVGIYWNNHHHLLHACERVTGKILWANLHLLFWLSLFPFVTGWMGENHFAAIPSVFYGGVLFFASVAYWILQQTIVRSQGIDSRLGKEIGGDRKGLASTGLYLVAMSVAFFGSRIAQGIYVIVALLWLVPDKRVERAIGERHGGGHGG